MRVPGWSLTFPIVEGTECLLIFADMCIDAWWQNSGVSPQADRRRHDLSDAFALFGPWSQPNRIPNYSNSSVQLRSDDESVVLDLSSSGVTITAASTSIKSASGTPLALVNDNWYQWYIAHVQPFLVGLGYSGPPPPVDSETTVLKAV
jgi:hypothetical protein